MRKRKVGGQYVPHLRELIEAPAWRVLSLSARRLLDRVEIEHMRHGGRENGRLAVTFDDFVEYGIDRHAVAPAMRECIALGLLVITRPGSAGNAAYRAPNLFRLPYLEADTSGQRWRQIATIEEAETIGKEAAGNRGRRGKKRRIKNKIPVVVAAKFQWCPPPPKTAFSGVVTATEKPPIPRGGNHHYYLDASHAAPIGKDCDANADAQHGDADPADATEIPEFLSGWRRARAPPSSR